MRPGSDHALAGSDGRYAFQVLPGEYGLVVIAPGYAAGNELLEVSGALVRDVRLERAAVLTGRVLTLDRRPVPDAHVSAIPVDHQDQMVLAPAQTDADGAFKLDNLRPGRYRLSARRGNLRGEVNQPTLITAGAGGRSVEILVEEGLTLSGTVLSASGRPVPQAVVMPWRRGGEIEVATTSVRTGEDGRFKLDGLRSGEYDVRLRAAGFASKRETVSVLANVVRDFTLTDAGQIDGVVLTPEGAPAKAAEVRARGPAESSAAAVSDDRGQFTLKDLGEGATTVLARAGMLVAQHGPEPLGAAEKKTITLRLSPGARIAGVVRWEDGQPAPNIRLSAYSRGSFGDPSGSSDAQGRFEVGPFLPGEVTVSAMPPGERTWFTGGARPEQAKVTLGPGERKTDVVLVIQRRDQSIRGQVLDASGVAVSGAVVQAAAEVKGRSYRGAAERRAVTDANGAFSIDQLPAGSHALWAEHPAHPVAELKGVASGSKDVRLQFAAAGIISGHVARAGRPVSDFQIQAMPSKPQQRPEADRQRVRDPQGAFRLERLPPGTYDVVATAQDGGMGVLRRVAVGPGETKAGLRLELAGTISVRGRAVDYDDGRPLADVRVNVRLPTGEQRSVVTDATGSFALPQLPPLPSVVVHLSTRTHAWEERTVTAPAKGDTLDVGVIRMVAIDSNNPYRGRFGVFYGDDGPRVTVKNISTGVPALAAGLRVGDLVLAVNGRDTSGMTGHEVALLMPRDPDAAVTLTVQTPGAAPRHVTFKRHLSR